MTTIYHRTMTVDGLEIFYREARPVSAPTVVLLHGFPTSSHMFRHLIPALSDTFHVVVPDYCGFGYSAMPTVEEFEYTFDHLADVIDGCVPQLGLAVKPPQRVQALIVQTDNAYAEGLGEFWQPFRASWKDRTAKNAAPLHKFLTLEATKWQSTHGVRNPEAIRPDHGIVDQSFQDRRATRPSSCSCATIMAPPSHGSRSGKPMFVPINRQRSWSGARMPPSFRPQAPIHTRGTCIPLHPISWILGTSPWKRMAR
jgi:hypothetical protein